MTFVKYHLPCKVCGGSDPVSVNEDGSGFCFSCEHYYRNYDEYTDQMDNNNFVRRLNTGLDSTKFFGPLEHRKIYEETCRKYGVKISKNSYNVVDRIYYPYYYGSELVATKIRQIKDKKFSWVGEASQSDLFGMNEFTTEYQYVTLVEGEDDAMAAFQMTGSKYPVVSVKSGSSALKDCKKCFEWLDKFKNIVICFDGDDVGLKATKEVAELFGGKALVMKHVKPHKDACDYLATNNNKAFVEAWWRSERFIPDGIVVSSSLHDEVMSELAMPYCSYPWDCLNLMLYGMRKSELITITAGTGVGKSTVVKQIQEEIFKNTEEKIGVISLEENVATAALGLMSLSANKPLHLPTREQMIKYILKDPSNIHKKPKLAESISLEEKEKAYNDILSGGRFFFLRHVGKFDMDSVLNKMKYLAKAEDCGVIVLDHISILVGMALGSNNDERKAIDSVMHHLRAVVEETGVSLIAISHLSKASNGRNSHEEGGRVRLGDLRGSNAIAHLSNIAIALEGNRQAEDPEERNMTTVRVLKNRFSGETGIAGYLKYDLQTGRLSEVDDYECGEVI